MLPLQDIFTSCQDLITNEDTGCIVKLLKLVQDGLEPFKLSLIPGRRVLLE